MQSMIVAIIILAIGCFLLWKHHKDMQLLETVTPRNRGEWSERKTILKLLKMGIDHRAIFHDCYIRKPNGSYTQVDLAVATSQGLIVFEIKDYSGWIFGHFRQKYWTQVLAYGKEKHRSIIQSCRIMGIFRRYVITCPVTRIYPYIQLSYSLAAVH